MGGGHRQTCMSHSPMSESKINPIEQTRYPMVTLLKELNFLHFVRNVILCTDCRQFLYVSQGEIKAQSDRNSNLGLELPTHYKISALPDKIKKTTIMIKNGPLQRFSNINKNNIKNKNNQIWIPCIFFIIYEHLTIFILKKSIIAYVC